MTGLTRDLQKTAGRTVRSLPKALLAASLVLAFMPNSSQLAEAQTQLRSSGQGQTAANAGQPGSSPKWKNIAAAPAGFPVPLFSGPGTMFLDLKLVPAASAGKRNISQIVLKTQSSPNDVANWYRAALQQQGLKESDLQAKSPEGAKSQVIRAESDSLTCNVVITPMPRQNETMIQVVAMRKSGH